MSATITITRARLLSLLEAERLLFALEAGGVDNWDWYSDSIDDHYHPPISADIDKEAVPHEPDVSKESTTPEP
jgi:hypothetical protein